MKSSNEDLAEDLFQEYSEAHGGEFRADQVDEVIETLDDRYGLEQIDLEDVELEQYQQEAIEVHLEGQEDSPIYVSPRHCVTHGNLTDKGGDIAPEGPALNQDGEIDGYGLR